MCDTENTVMLVIGLGDCEPEEEEICAQYNYYQKDTCT